MLHGVLVLYFLFSLSLYVYIYLSLFHLIFIHDFICLTCLVLFFTHGVAVHFPHSLSHYVFVSIYLCFCCYVMRVSYAFCTSASTNSRVFSTLSTIYERVDTRRRLRDCGEGVIYIYLHATERGSGIISGSSCVVA